MVRILAFVLTYVKLNLQVALEYRVSFWTQVFAMALNDAMWVTFWALFFSRFPVVRGYEFRDVVMLWSFGAFSFGLATAVCGGSWRFAEHVAQGGLDFFLILPKPVLLHVIVSRMSVSAWGDVVFGLGCYLALARPASGELALFLALSLGAAVVFVSYAVVVKVLLFTVLPAGLITWVPVGLIRQWDWGVAGLLVLGDAAIVCLAVAVFHAGLRRYESGNLLAMRG